MVVRPQTAPPPFPYLSRSWMYGARNGDSGKVADMLPSSTITPRSEWRQLSKQLERHVQTVVALDLLLEAIEEGRLTDKTLGQRPGRGVVLWLDRHADVSHGIMTAVLESAGVDRLPNNRFQLLTLPRY